MISDAQMQNLAYYGSQTIGASDRGTATMAIVEGRTGGSRRVSINSKNPRLLNSAEVSNWLGIAQRTVCLWAELAEIPAFKLGHQWRFREDEVDRWLEIVTRASPANQRNDR
jgi:excisionase family DNA binding protein